MKPRCTENKCLGKELRKENPFSFRTVDAHLSKDQKDYLKQIEVNVDGLNETHFCKQCGKEIWKYKHSMG